MPKDIDEMVAAADMHGAPSFIKNQVSKAKRTKKPPLSESQIRAIAKKNGIDADTLLATAPTAAAGPDPVGVEETVNETEERELAEAPKTVIRTPMKREYPVDDSKSAATLEDFLGLGEEIGRMLANKNRKYGDSYARMAHVLPMFYPDGVPGDHLLDAVFILRIIDKLMRIASAQGDDEEDPVKDIAGYAILRMREMRNSE
jgi:hypothetical protein